MLTQLKLQMGADFLGLIKAPQRNRKETKIRTCGVEIGFEKYDSAGSYETVILLVDSFWQMDVLGSRPILH